MGYWLAGFIIIATIAVSCYSSKKETLSNLPVAQISAADSLKGMEIFAADNCITCHSISKRLIGPSFTEISKKYKPNDRTIDKLAKKIISGGSGSWGQIPMTPHPTLSTDSARTIVKFILSLENH